MCVSVIIWESLELDMRHMSYTNIHVRDTYLEDEWRLGDKHDASDEEAHDQRPEEAARLPQEQERHDHDKHRGAKNDGGGVA